MNLQRVIEDAEQKVHRAHMACNRIDRTRHIEDFRVQFGHQATNDAARALSRLRNSVYGARSAMDQGRWNDAKIHVNNIFCHMTEVERNMELAEFLAP